MPPIKETHILMVSLFYQGHINPMLRFAKLLVSKGLHVTLATTEHARDRVQIGIGQYKDISLEFFVDGLADDVDRDKNLDILLKEYLPRAGVKNLSNLIHELEGKGKKFSCIIVNNFVPWVINVAKNHNISCAMLWVQSCATFSISCHYFRTPSMFPSLLNLEDTIEVPGLFPLLKVSDLPTYILPSSPPHFRNVVATTIDNIDQFDWIFGSSFQEIEESIINSIAKIKPILPIGPLVPPTMFDEHKDFKHDGDLCMNWLDKQSVSSVIYIALGSISVLSQSETNAIAKALESDTKHRFLWVRKEGEKGWGRKMGDLPEGFLEKTKERGLVVSWCCQEKILTHPSIKCFLTHCGWNSTLEAITAGVPVIAYPDWTDQLTNAKLLVDVFKVGVRMIKSCDRGLEKEEVERCFMEVSEGPNALAMKAKAIKWKKAAKRATLVDGSSYKVIDNFVNEVKCKEYKIM